MYEGDRRPHVNIPSQRLLQLLQDMPVPGPRPGFVDRAFVDSVAYNETYPFDTATFGSTTTREVNENQAGFHVGGDVSWYFTETVGVGGVVGSNGPGMLTR